MADYKEKIAALQQQQLDASTPGELEGGDDRSGVEETRTVITSLRSIEGSLTFIPGDPDNPLYVQTPDNGNLDIVTNTNLHLPS